MCEHDTYAQSFSFELSIFTRIKGKTFCWPDSLYYPPIQTAHLSGKIDTLSWVRSVWEVNLGFIVEEIESNGQQ